MSEKREECAWVSHGVLLFVEELCSSLFLIGKFLDDSAVEIRDMPGQFFLYGEHGQSIKAILCHGVPEKSFYSFQSGKAPLRL